MNPDDLDTGLRSFFAGADLDVSAPAGTDLQILAGARRRRRRTTTVRAVAAVAAVTAAGTALAARDGGGAHVEPAKMQDPRCQEWWVPPTPSPGEPGAPFDYPTWTADPEPLGPQIDPFTTDTPQITPTPWESLHFTPKPMRGPHGGTLCTVVRGTPDVLTREGFVWPTDLPVPTYSMEPGSTPGMSVPPAPGSPEDMDAYRRALEIRRRCAQTPAPTDVDCQSPVPGESVLPTAPATSPTTRPTTSP